MGTMQAPPAPGSFRESTLANWARTHTVAALRSLYALAALAFLGMVFLLRHPPLLGVMVGFVAARFVLVIAERIGERVFIEHIAAGEIEEAVVSPGVTKARQIQVLRRLCADRSERAVAQAVATYAAFCVTCGRTDYVSIMRAFEDHWGVPPNAGEDTSLVRSLLARSFRFTTPCSPPPDLGLPMAQGIPWRALWRDRQWSALRGQHPGESLGRLLLRLYASEWQSLLSPIWVMVFIGCALLLGKPILPPVERGVVFYLMVILLGVSASWLAFVLRPGAFNSSLLASDMDRCARWVLESTEGKHFLVSALGSTNRRLRHQAVQLLLWHDALLTASLTLPEGMRAFLKRERG